MENTITKPMFLEQKKLNPNNFLYVGIDVHKDQHTALGVNCFGQPLWQKEIGNSKEDFLLFDLSFRSVLDFLKELM